MPTPERQMPEERIRFRTLYTNLNFMKLWIAQFICQLADRMFVYILIVSMYHLVKSNLGSSLPMVSFGVPAVLFSLIFGVLVDRHKKKNILFSSNIIRALLIVTIPLVPFFYNSIIGLFLISFVAFTISQLFIPAELAAITYIVNKKELILANSLFVGTWMMASVLSFGIAVPITYHLGIKATYLIITGLYVFSALCIALMSIPEKLQYKRIEFKSFRRELRTGVRFALRHRVIFYSLIQMGFGVSILAALSTLSIGFVDKVLHRPDSDFGYLVAISGIGMGVGISLISRMIKYFKKPTIVFLGFNIVGSMLIILGLVNNIIAAFVVVFILGIGNAFISAPIQTIIQERTPSSIRGKVFSVQNLISSFAFMIPPVCIGILADITGDYKIIFIGLGVLSLLLNLSIRKLEK